MRNDGQIQSWNDEKGYGFIAPADRSERVFLHISALKRRHVRPRIGDTVQYELGTDEKNRPRAVTAQLGRGAEFSAAGLFRLGVAGLFLVAVGLGVLAGAVERWILWVYLGASLLAWIDYWHDKTKAQKGKWRISEQTLHLWALLGGWPGALVAQQFLRHKNRKLSFQVEFWLIVLLHLALWGWHFRDSALVAGIIARL